MQNPSEVKTTKDLQLSVRVALSTKKEESWKESDNEFSNLLDHSDDDEANFDARMRRQILRKRKELDDLPTKQKLNKGQSLSGVGFYKSVLLLWFVQNQALNFS